MALLSFGSRVIASSCVIHVCVPPALGPPVLIALDQHLHRRVGGACLQHRLPPPAVDHHLVARRDGRPRRPARPRPRRPSPAPPARRCARWSSVPASRRRAAAGSPARRCLPSRTRLGAIGRVARESARTLVCGPMSTSATSPSHASIVSAILATPSSHTPPRYAFKSKSDAQPKCACLRRRLDADADRDVVGAGERQVLGGDARAADGVVRRGDDELECHRRGGAGSGAAKVSSAKVPMSVVEDRTPEPRGSAPVRRSSPCACVQRAPIPVVGGC